MSGGRAPPVAAAGQVRSGPTIPLSPDNGASWSTQASVGTCGVGGSHPAPFAVWARTPRPPSCGATPLPERRRGLLIRACWNGQLSFTDLGITIADPCRVRSIFGPRGVSRGSECIGRLGVDNATVLTGGGIDLEAGVQDHASASAATSDIKGISGTSHVAGQSCSCQSAPDLCA